jgi:hypothetical protein
MKESPMNDVLDLVKRAAPSINECSITHASDHAAQLTLEQIVRSPRVAPHSQTKKRVVSLVAATGIIAGVVLFESIIPNATPTAAAAVSRAVNQLSTASTGKAISHSKVTQDGVPFSGTVTVMWNGDDEDYAFDYSPPGPGTFGIRVVDGQQYRSTATGVWEKTGRIANPSGLSTSPDRFDVLRTRITFIDADDDVIDGVTYRHVVATGDLSPLDSATARAGFLFGTNGAEGARTTSLELWLDPKQGIRRIRDSFVGENEGLRIAATTQTDLYDIGQPVVITRPTTS